jgi:UDP-N-acetylmuramate: L-alanyl-gamma-D-glutamyl-meso-diaminopimelate ligase
MTSLEFDHADIYSNLYEIETWFRRLVNIIPSQGSVAYCASYPLLEKIAANSFAPVFSFGDSAAAEIFCRFERYAKDMTEFTLYSSETGEISCSTPLFGGFNLLNAAAAASMAIKLGVDAASLKAAFSSFTGVKRRQELIFSSPSVKVYEDFAHHPTAVKAVLESVRERHPHSKIYAVYEPRSATSRRASLQEEISAAFQSADEVFMKRPFNLAAVPQGERIDIEYVIAQINRRGVLASIYDGVDEIIDALCGRLSGAVESVIESVIIIMSNGGFDGIYGKITERLRER